MKQLQDLLCWADSPCSVNSELSNCCYIQRGSGRAHVPARAHTQPSVLPAICTGTLQSQTRLKLLSHTASCAPLCALCSHISAKAQAAEDALKPPGAVRVGPPKSQHIYIYICLQKQIFTKINDCSGFQKLFYTERAGVQRVTRAARKPVLKELHSVGHFSLIPGQSALADFISVKGGSGTYQSRTHRLYVQVIKVENIFWT